MVMNTIDRKSDAFYLNSYSGEGGYKDGTYLVPHLRESDDKFLRRKLLAVYPNFVRKIVDVMMGFLWRQAPSRETDDLYAQFASNADGAGTKLDTLLFSYQRLAMILGTVYVIVDKPQSQGATRADQAMPYFALRLPGQLVEEKKNAAGTWEKVVFSEIDNGVTQYRTFTLTEWIISRKSDGTDIIDQGTHNLKKVPVVRFHVAKPLNPTDSRSQSWVNDIAQLNWSLFNAESEMNELFRGQTFAILSFPVTTKEDAERLKDMTIGVENAITYNPQGGGKPEFIAAPATSIELYMKKIAGIIETIYRLANLEFIGSVQPSGEALKYHFYEANSALGGMAEMAEAAETEMAQLVYLWQGQPFNGNIAYPKEFNMADLASAIATALDSVTLGMGATFVAAIKKRLAKQILGNDTAPSTMTEIDKEIDAGGDPYGNRVQQQAGLL